MRKRRSHRNYDMPPQEEAIFDGISISPGPLVQHIILKDPEGMNPAPYTANISTFAIELHCKNAPKDPREREKFRSSVEGMMQQVDRDLEFYRYDYTRQPRTTTINWDAQPPVATIAGTFTLDQLNKMVELNILETNLNVAHALNQASLAEYRGPLMTGGEEYNPRPAPEEYQRDKITPHTDTAIGDIGNLHPDQAYEEAIHQIREGLARGQLNRLDFGGAVYYLAQTTLGGSMESPYPTEAKLLTDGSQQVGTQALAHSEIVKERIQQIAQDVMGPEHQLVWNEQDKTRDYGTKQQVTVEQFAERVRTQNSSRAKQEKIPEWWTGSKSQWERQAAENFREGMEGFMHMVEETKAAGGLEAVIAEATKDVDPNDPMGERRHMKATLKAKHKGGGKAGDMVLASVTGDLATPNLTAHDLTFFGVKHRFVNGYDPDNLRHIEYQSRNPLVNAPRALHPRLEAELEREARLGTSQTQRVMEDLPVTRQIGS